MSIQIIRHRERVTKYEYRLTFGDKLVRGASYAFPCDKQGFLLMDQLGELGMPSLVRVLWSKRYGKPVVDTYQNTYTVAAIGKCECGREVVLGGDSACHCGRWYNAFGQELAPPSQWGYETGERFDDDGNQTVFVDDDY